MADKPADMSQEDWELNRWPEDSGKMLSIAARVVFRTIGVIEEELDPHDFKMRLFFFNSFTAGGDLGQVGPAWCPVPIDYELIELDGYTVYLKRHDEPAEKRGHVINYRGTYELFVESHDRTWRHQHMHFVYHPAPARSYLDNIESSKRMRAWIEQNKSK